MRSREARAIDQLDEHAARRARMEEGDIALCAPSRLAIDQLHPPLRQRAEGRPEIVNDEAEVVQ